MHYVLDGPAYGQGSRLLGYSFEPSSRLSFPVDSMLENHSHLHRLTNSRSGYVFEAYGSRVREAERMFSNTRPSFLLEPLISVKIRKLDSNLYGLVVASEHVHVQQLETAKIAWGTGVKYNGAEFPVKQIEYFNGNKSGTLHLTPGTLFFRKSGKHVFEIFKVSSDNPFSLPAYSPPKDQYGGNFPKSIPEMSPNEFVEAILADAKAIFHSATNAPIKNTA